MLKKFKPNYNYLVLPAENNVFPLFRNCTEWFAKVKQDDEIQSNIGELVAYLDAALADYATFGPDVSHTFTVQKDFYWRAGYPFDAQKLALLNKMYQNSTPSQYLYTLLSNTDEEEQRDTWVVSAVPDVFLCCEDMTTHYLGVLLNVGDVPVWWTSDRWFGIILPVTPDGHRRFWHYSLPQTKTSLYVPKDQLTDCPLKPVATVSYHLVYVEPNTQLIQTEYERMRTQAKQHMHKEQVARTKASAQSLAQQIALGVSSGSIRLKNVAQQP